VFSDTAKKKSRSTGSAMRSHDDQTGLNLLGNIDNHRWRVAFRQPVLHAHVVVGCAQLVECLQGPCFVLVGMMSRDNLFMACGRRHDIEYDQACAAIPG